MKFKDIRAEYKGKNKNMYQPMEMRELRAIIGLWIMWGIRGDRKISHRALFSIDESLASYGRCYNKIITLKLFRCTHDIYS